MTEYHEIGAKRLDSVTSNRSYVFTSQKNGLWV